MGQDYYTEDLATWNQAKAYQIRIDFLLRQSNYFSTIEMDFTQWGNCLLGVYREIVPYIEKDKGSEEIKTKREAIINLLSKPEFSPKKKAQLWVVCDNFHQSLMVIMERRGLLMQKSEDMALKI